MNKLRLLLSASITFSMVSLGAVPAVFAVEATTTPSNNTQEVKEPTAEEKAKKLADMKKRLDATKASLKTKIDETTKKRVIAKCKPAQAIVKTAESNAALAKTNRSKAYTSINESVQKLVDKLKADNKDTTEIEADIAMMQQKADAVILQLTTYEQTLSDMSLMDCAADPIAFQATLESARKQRTDILTAATEVRTYAKETLKPAIAKFKPIATDNTVGTQ